MDSEVAVQVIQIISLVAAGFLGITVFSFWVIMAKAVELMNKVQENPAQITAIEELAKSVPASTAEKLADLARYVLQNADRAAGVAKEFAEFTEEVFDNVPAESK